MLYALNFILGFLVVLISGLCWRLRGGGFYKFNGTFKARLFGWTIPFSVLMTSCIVYKDWHHLTNYSGNWIYLILATLVTYVCVYLSLIVVGHGAYMDGGTSAFDREFLEIPLESELEPQAWRNQKYDFVNMGMIGPIRGFVMVLPMLYFYPALICIPVYGVFSAYGYLIGWMYYRLNKEVFYADFKFSDSMLYFCLVVSADYIGKLLVPVILACIPSDDMAYPTSIGEFLTGACFGFGLIVATILI